MWNLKLVEAVTSDRAYEKGGKKRAGVLPCSCIRAWSREDRALPWGGWNHAMDHRRRNTCTVQCVLRVPF